MYKGSNPSRAFFLRKHPCAGGVIQEQTGHGFQGKGNSTGRSWQKQFPRKWQTEVPGCELGSILDPSKNIEYSRNEDSSLNSATTITTTTSQ